MKNIYHMIVIFLLISCNRIPQKEINVVDIPIQQARFYIHNIDSTKILNPGGIYCYKNHVILIERKNNPAFSFWTSDSLRYEFSEGFIGGGPNEFIRPRSNYFAVSDSSFFILDSNIEWEVQLEEQRIQVINKEPIIIPDAINQMVHLDNGKYIMAGNTDGNNNAEHFLYDIKTGEYTLFGEYPFTDLFDERKFFFNFKYTAGIAGKPYIWDFYENYNLLRKYSIEGILLQEVRLVGVAERHNDDSKSHELQNRPYWRIVQATSRYIYALFYTGETDKTIYTGGAIPELQVWDWDGNLTRRILFDKKYNQITVSETGILYAINTVDTFNNQIYSYEM